MAAARTGSPSWLWGGLKEAALQALVALILAVPLIGLKTVQEPGGLGLQTRWDAVAIAVAGAQNAALTAAALFALRDTAVAEQRDR